MNSDCDTMDEFNINFDLKYEFDDEEREERASVERSNVEMFNSTCTSRAVVRTTCCSATKTPPGTIF